MQKDVLFIDAYNLIYRAFHGNMAQMTNGEGMPTNAIFTVCRMLRALPKSYDIRFALAVFDGGGGNFRHDIDSEYKATRKPMPEALKVQIPHIKRAFEVLGWPIMQAQGVEADDVIATLAKRAAAKDFNSYIISGDKDFLALVSDNLKVVNTMTKITYGRAEVIAKLGVTPEQVTDYLAITGDSVDNVIGIEKVGTKTAAKWLRAHSDIEGIIAVAEQITGVVGENLRAAIASGQLLKNRSLIALKTDVEVDVRVQDVRLKPVDDNAWEQFCIDMDFKSLLQKKPSP